jgi:phosphoserine aminotransferase
MIEIPKDLLPRDGRFGCGPAKVRGEALAALAGSERLLGTSHRQQPVRELVKRVRAGLCELLRAPEGYELALGNGGATLFWDAAALALIERRSLHLSLGEFSAKFAKATAAAPFLEAPRVIASELGSAPAVASDVSCDAACWPHNETSTGVMLPVQRPNADWEGLVLIDATSAVGCAPVDLGQCDAYYFSPQKGLASDGGLWLAFLSPRAIERIERLSASGRWIPPSLSLNVALENSRQDQTYNTPALATLILVAAELDWMIELGGLDACAARCRTSSSYLYAWAQAREFASPFVADPALRSPCVVTIDFEGVDAARIATVLRAHGVVDVEPYRKLGRNQLRIGTFPAVEPDDVQALCASIDYVVEQLRHAARPRIAPRGASRRPSISDPTRSQPSSYLDKR